MRKCLRDLVAWRITRAHPIRVIIILGKTLDKVFYQAIEFKQILIHVSLNFLFVYIQPLAELLLLYRKFSQIHFGEAILTDFLLG